MLWIKAGAAIALVLAIWFHGRSNGKEAGEREVASLQAEYAQAKAESAARLAYLSEQARVKEQQWSEDLAIIAAKLEDDKQRVADETKQSVLADIRNGRLRVRLPSCSGVSAASQDSTGPGVDHGQAGSGAEIAAAAIGIGAEADARLAACQAAHTAIRGPRP
jgi:hypothetical protein